MLESMTGYGQSETRIDDNHLKIEVKSLNSKFLDLSLKFPRELSSLETEVRSLIQEVLKRGKVNVQIELSGPGIQPHTEINEELLKAYYAKFKTLSEELGNTNSDLFRLALQSPEVIVAEDSKFDLDWDTLKQALESAMKMCSDFRAKEGAVLQKKLSDYITTIDEKLEGVKSLDGQRVEHIKSRISRNLDEIRDKVKIDENRFEQEVIYYLEKLDITEEKVRLKNHLNYFLEVMKSKTSEGKKLGFISQEIGREINTIGSKANNADIQQLVVEMKDELEKVKEQLLNIL